MFQVCQKGVSTETMETCLDPPLIGIDHGCLHSLCNPLIQNSLVLEDGSGTTSAMEKILHQKVLHLFVNRLLPKILLFLKMGMALQLCMRSGFNEEGPNQLTACGEFIFSENGCPNKPSSNC